MATRQCSLDQLPRMTDTGHQHRGLEVVVLVGRHNLTNELHSVSSEALAFAASNAYVGGKHRVTLTLIPSVAIRFVAWSPSEISGTLPIMC